MPFSFLIAETSSFLFGFFFSISLVPCHKIIPVRTIFSLASLDGHLCKSKKSIVCSQCLLSKTERVPPQLNRAGHPSLGALHQATPRMPHAHRLSAGVNRGAIPDLSAPKPLALTSCQKSQCALGPESGGASEHTAEKASSCRGRREVVPCCRGWFGKRWKGMLDSVPCGGGEVTSSLHRCGTGKSTNLSIPQCDKHPLRPYV